jgi:NADH:ubiquinone oxidoreductase subunit 6 (subunit J)
MTPEYALFLVSAVVAVFFSAIMLISKNAVHSALSLVVTMLSIAFMFLLLNAPFLAMIQITVYAGAIMVLFLFVIMLLGSEQPDTPDIPGPGVSRFKWFFGMATIGAFALFVIFGLVFITANLDTREIPEPDPLMRLVHTAADVGAVNVLAGDEVIAEDVSFLDTSSFVSVPAGETTLTLQPIEGSAPFTLPLTLEAGTTQTVIAYGEGEPVFAVIPTDLSTVSADRSGRVVLFNGYDALPEIAVVDLGSELDPDDTRAVVPAMPLGEASEAFYVTEGGVDWTIVDSANADNVLFRLRDYDVERDTSQILVITSERQFDDTIRAGVLPVSLEAAPSFGGPRAIGYSLFTTFMLPFQLLALLLLAAMVGVIVLTHREPVRERKIGGRRRVSRPLVNVIAAQVGQDSVTEAAQQTVPQLPTVASASDSKAAGD